KEVLADDTATSTDVDNALAALKAAYASLEKLEAEETTTQSATEQNTTGAASTDATSATGETQATDSNKTTVTSDNSVVKTGDSSLFIMIALIAAVGGAGVFCYFRKRKNFSK
ncbi:MAG: LPXTG cell wall anchor domain-containing protein, partial [Eubacterium sp.]